jgi:site-specific DNA-methyltransferase (adenine-specific)
MQVIHGSAIEVLRTLPENSIDVVYTCPSPFEYYKDPNLIGGEENLNDYIQNLVQICNECSRVLKPTGNLFIQLGDKFTRLGTLLGIPTIFERRMIGEGWALNDRLIWHRSETQKRTYQEKGFLKNYEYIFHFIHRDFYFNTKSKYINTSVFSYPLEDSYYTNEFDSGLPTELSKMVIDTCCPEKGTVLDPLAGSCKLGIVAKKLNRDFIGIDINLETVELARIRLGLIIH